ncbi:MAG: Hsp20/alpha crystallin family protein [Candidatus Colwellbacteria bacterium]|nr:Hsp20/alpha crystallin family protein [Candidatus Colwellbacteria bacterium]
MKLNIDKEEKSDKEPTEIGDEGEGQLTVDVYQTPDEIVVESTIAGVDKDNIDIDVTTESVTIRGERRREERIDESDYFYQECFWGKFSRSIILPQEIDPDKAHSSIKNGILTIHLPKIHRNKSRKIKIKDD